MLRIRYIIVLVLFCCFAFPASAVAADLWDVYKLAIQTDPTLQIKRNESLSEAENLPIARSALLPHFDTGFAYSHVKQNRDDNDLSGENAITNTHKSFSMNLKQSIFNGPDWLNVRAASYSQKSAYFNYLAAVQDLIVRTTEAYFKVLTAEDALIYAKAYQTNLGKDLNQVKFQFNAGLLKRVDVDTAQASYEQSLLNTMDAKNKLISQQLELEKITGYPVGYLAKLKPSFPLLLPKNLSFSNWKILIAVQNKTVLADREKAKSAETTVEKMRAGHYPTVEVEAKYTRYFNQNAGFSGSRAFAVDNDQTIGLAARLPLFEGGKVVAQTRQAAYDYQIALAQSAFDFRAAKNKAQNSDAAIITDIGKIKTDRALITAEQKALKSTRVAYQAGLSNMNIRDLLQAENNLYLAQQNYSSDQYDYIINIIKLKKAVGNLTSNDLRIMNAWLI